MKIITLALFIMLSSNSYGLDLNLEKKITEIAQQRCNSEFKEGKDFEVEVLASGDLKISLLGKKGAGLDGAFIYKKNEWRAKPRVIPEHQAAENHDFRKCVDGQSKELMSRYQPDRQKGTSYLKEKLAKMVATKKDLLNKKPKYTLIDLLDEKNKERVINEMLKGIIAYGDVYGEVKPFFDKDLRAEITAVHDEALNAGKILAGSKAITAEEKKVKNEQLIAYLKAGGSFIVKLQHVVDVQISRIDETMGSL